MTLSVRNWQLWCVSLVAVLFLATTVVAAEGRGRPAKIGPYNSDAQTVEMFAAIEKGDIAVKLIPKDSTECRIMIENKTDQPLNVKLPDAFAGVPVLAQNAAGSRRSSSSSSNNSNQSMGGGMGMGMGGGMFSVPAEQVGKFKVPTVCLEHGKAEPRPAVPYEIKPIDSLTAKPGVRELCQMLGTGQINQRAAQAAAWHLNNNMSWQELAAKRLRHANGATEPYFSQTEIQGGMQVATAAIRTAKERENAATPTLPTTNPSAIKTIGE